MSLFRCYSFMYKACTFWRFVWGSCLIVIIIIIIIEFQLSSNKKFWILILWATFKNTIILFACPPKFCKSIVFISPWDYCMSQEKMETMSMQTLGGQAKSIMVFLKVVYWDVNNSYYTKLVVKEIQWLSYAAIKDWYRK